jgi:hypothetical protein
LGVALAGLGGGGEGLLPDGADPGGAHLGFEGFGAGSILERYLGHWMRGELLVESRNGRIQELTSTELLEQISRADTADVSSTKPSEKADTRAQSLQRWANEVLCGRGIAI